jgi:hypothetical protein
MRKAQYLAILAAFILSRESIGAQEFPSFGGAAYRDLLRAAFAQIGRFARFLAPSKTRFLADGGSDGGSSDGGSSSGDGGSSSDGGAAGAAGRPVPAPPEPVLETAAEAPEIAAVVPETVPAAPETAPEVLETAPAVQVAPVRATAAVQVMRQRRRHRQLVMRRRVPRPTRRLPIRRRLRQPRRRTMITQPLLQTPITLLRVLIPIRLRSPSPPPSTKAIQTL